MLTIDDIHTIVDAIEYPNFTVVVHLAVGECPMLQGSYVTDEGPRLTRPWMLSYRMAPSEVVKTALALILEAAQQEVRDHFLYHDQAIFATLKEGT